MRQPPPTNGVGGGGGEDEDDELPCLRGGRGRWAATGGGQRGRRARKAGWGKKGTRTAWRRGRRRVEPGRALRHVLLASK